MTDITPTVAAMPTSAETVVAPGPAPVQPSSVSAPSRVGVPVIRYTPTTSRWVVHRDATRIGSIDHVGAFIATNQHMDVLGAFVELADAQLAIVDPQPADADMVRRTRAHQLHRETRLRRATLIAVGAVLVLLVVGAVLVLLVVGAVVLIASVR